MFDLMISKNKTAKILQTCLPRNIRPSKNYHVYGMHGTVLYKTSKDREMSITVLLSRYPSTGWLSVIHLRFIRTALLFIIQIYKYKYN